MRTTKQLLADSLMELLETEPFDKITVKDISAKCGVSRQSFYYYFDDIYDLVEWIFLQETQNALSDYSRIDNWQIGYVLMLNWALSHKSFVMNIYKSVPREYTERYMKRVLHEYMFKLVEQQAQGMHVTQAQCEFIANFFTLALNAFSLDWIENGMREQPEEMAQEVSILVQGDFQKALTYFEKKNTK